MSYVQVQTRVIWGCDQAWKEVEVKEEGGRRGGPRAVLLGCTQCTVVMMGSDKTRITRLYPACLYCLNTSWLTTNTTCRLFCSALSSIVLGGLYSESVSCSIVVQRFWVKARLGHLNSGETATSNWMCGLLAPSIHFCTVQRSQTNLGRSKKNTLEWM